MRLVKLKLTDFRRFAGEQSLDLNENVIALVGPNEAGKSSILSAIESVGRQEPPKETDTTRGSTSTAVIAALFSLDQADKAALADTGGGSDVNRVWVTRKAGSDLSTWDLEPYPMRDLTPRRHCAQVFRSFKDRPPLTASLHREIMQTLLSKDETLPEEALSRLAEIAEEIKQGKTTLVNPRLVDDLQPSARKQRRLGIADKLSKIVDIERKPTPSSQVVDILEDRIPDIAAFSAPDRELQSTYQLNDVTANQPSALGNLCTLAELDLIDVKTAVASGRMGRVEHLFEIANAKLKEKFRGVWRQSPIYPRLSGGLDGVLRVFVATEEGDYTFPEERSDGLRWFIALHAFLVARGQHEPILLIDETETHLHYDAQADLIDALMNQRIAKQVIYTTHSVGCLPPDLGCGIRVTLAEEGKERSRIANSYWSVQPASDEKVGYAPLLFAMGARLLALTTPRFGVITEGPSDAILLPSLLREAASTDNLPYRIVPGLSEIAKSHIPSLSHYGGKVVALADGDAEGQTICNALRDAGIPGSSIFHLGRVRTDCTLEDLVDATVLSEAINTELETWGIDPLRVGSEDLPSTGRWAWLVKRGVETNTAIHRLSKPRVAQRAVDIGRSARLAGSPRNLLSMGDVEGMRQLHDHLCKELEVLPEA